jgi:hypothetical protein
VRLSFNAQSYAFLKGGEGGGKEEKEGGEGGREGFANKFLFYSIQQFFLRYFSITICELLVRKRKIFAICSINASCGVAFLALLRQCFTWRDSCCFEGQH